MVTNRSEGGCNTYSTKLSVSIHILCMIARNPDSSVTSDYIAGSIQTNPALVRRLMSRLKKANLIHTQTKLGATGLAKASSEISLMEIFRAVEPEQRIFDIHTDTNMKCPVGANIGKALTRIYDQVQENFEKQLEGIYLSDILKIL